MTDIDAAPTASTIDAAALADIVGYTWQTFVGEELGEPIPVAALTPGEAPVPCATISIGGTWTATLAVTMANDLVAQFASALLACPSDELDPADVADAFGELANVVGGNVKGLIEDASATLSLPVVSSSPPAITGGQLTIQVGFDVAGSAMIWELWERV